ncbi:anaphase-promoting complex, subunit 10-domain-containing protein [Kalaharituber pfeilii]|nr:anaphase-promoting complex, subunit 10-domain-containing protein [Kalaharituber pfeilii]
MPRSRARTQHQQRHEPTPIVSDDQSLLDAVEGLPEDDFGDGNVGIDEDLETDHELEGEEGAEDSLLTTTTTTTTPASLDHLKEIGNLASWTVSTAKPGCGVAELRSEDTNLFWQSDGPQPHTINIHFAKRVCIRLLRIYLDYKSDESYTPTKIAVMSGTGYHDLQEVCTMVLEEPLGWVEVDLGAGGTVNTGDEDRNDVVGGGGCLRSWLVQVVILGNHQNGKDTHVRGLQVFSANPTFELEEVPYTNSGMLAELEVR